MTVCVLVYATSTDVLIKIDAQGHDVDILRGTGHCLRERVVRVTAEKTAGGCVEPGHEEHDLLDFMF